MLSGQAELKGYHFNFVTNRVIRTNHEILYQVCHSASMHPRKQQFRENFDDSEANYSENQGRPVLNSSGRPLQLIRIERDGQITVLPEALQIICSYNQPVGFVSLAGKTRTGKSCLLNRLLNIKGQGFRVESSTDSCTQGIWMWSDPFHNQKYHNLIFFLDTEGTDSLVKDSQNDTKIFTLAVLISSFFIYNSIGSIDQRSISELQMVTALSKKIKMGDEADSAQVIRFMPKFMWLLRDFMLQIQDKNFRKISSNTYLENCLNEEGQGGRDQKANKIKKSILTYFPIRQCLTLVRPVYEEEMIYNLNQLEDHRLRRQFIDGVNTLRNKVIQGTGPKLYGGKEISGPGMAVMIQNYADSFNNGEVPNIRSAWQQISADEGNQAYRSALQVYERIFDEHLSDQRPYNEPQLNKITNKLRLQTINRYRQQIGNNMQEHRDIQRKLQDFIFNSQQQIIQNNESLCERYNNGLIGQYSLDIKTKLQSQYYVGTKGASQLASDIDKCKGMYSQEAIGKCQGAILAQFATTLAPIIMLIQTDNSAQREEDERQRRIAEQEHKRQIKLMEQKNKSMQNRINAQQRTENIKDKKASRKNIKNMEEQKKKGGCCGTGCLIM